MFLVFISAPDTRLPTRTLSTVSSLCLLFFALFWWQGFQLGWSPLRLQGVLGQHASVGAFGLIPLRKNVPVFLLFLLRAGTVQDGTLCSFGQGTISGLPCYPQRQCRRSASSLFWAKFIYRADIASSCDMVGMCTGMSSALCSPGLPPLILLELVLLLH